MRTPTKKKTFPIVRENRRVFAVIMTPFLLMFLGFRVFPVLWGVFMSFTNYSGFNIKNLKMVGWSNYVRVFTDTLAFQSFGRTVLIALIVVPITLLICNVLAIMLSRPGKLNGFFRTIYYIPSIIPVVAVSTMWQGVFARDYGILNYVLRSMGIGEINWLGYDWIFRSLIIMMLWGCGGGILNNIAGIKNIPTELYEAAKIDGASSFRQILHITLPLTSNMNYMTLTTSLIATLQLFAEPVLLAGGGMTSVPYMPIYTYVVHCYQQIFVNLRFGYGLALTWVIFLIIMVFTLVNEAVSKKWVVTSLD